MFQIHLFRKPRQKSDGYFHVTSVFYQLGKKRKCFFVTLACNKLFSNMGTEINNQRELEKHFKNQILKQNIFTVPDLESEIWQEVRLRPSIHTTCQNLNWKKREWLLILNSIFFGLSSFYSFFHLVYHNRRNFFSKA